MLKATAHELDSKKLISYQFEIFQYKAVLRYNWLNHGNDTGTTSYLNRGTGKVTIAEVGSNPTRSHTPRVLQWQLESTG